MKLGGASSGPRDGGMAPGYYLTRPCFLALSGQDPQGSAFPWGQSKAGLWPEGLRPDV
jgi:hypothetical protein